MVDIQNSRDKRNIPINCVGIKNIRYPIVVQDRKNQRQPTVADVSLYVNLPHHYRGTHMSRLVEVLNEFKGEVSYKNLDRILLRMKERLNAEKSHLEFSFPYFLTKKAPVTLWESLMSYDCIIAATYDKHLSITTTVRIPVHTLCPCSKEISDFSAHNQRGYVTITVEMIKFVWIEDLITIAEESASCPLYSLLKREDEKYITEQAYKNPKFVEDVVREVAARLEKLSYLRFFSVEAENMESIHNHSAYAMIRRDFKVDRP
ncbi:MAG: GTP cyclohydrolase I FolE2 [Spirochaetes bacterium]|nr:GTP cyclohydrolase I FolE2 [Spirochaetota bacterium]